MRLLCVIFATCFCICPASHLDSLTGSVQSALAGPDSVCVIACQSQDLDGDGTFETVVITSKSIEDGHPVGGEIVVLRESEGELRPVWRRDGLNPWKLETGDVDGDGQREIAVGVWKKSPFDPIMANRVFIYYWNGGTMQPKWLGSRLSRRFDDFILYDINLDDWDELIALETAGEDMHRVAVYRWDIFGFEWLGCSEEMPGISGFYVEEGILNALTMSGRLRIEFLNDNVELEPLE